jgi:hypothetical protein
MPASVTVPANNTIGRRPRSRHIVKQLAHRRHVGLKIPIWIIGGRRRAGLRSEMKNHVRIGDAIPDAAIAGVACDINDVAPGAGLKAVAPIARRE